MVMFVMSGHKQDDLQAVVIISAAQVMCMSVSVSDKVSQSKGSVRTSHQ